jgi:hypothetical protein
MNEFSVVMRKLIPSAVSRTRVAAPAESCGGADAVAAGEEATLVIAFPGASRERLGRPPGIGSSGRSESLVCVRIRRHVPCPGTG